MARAGDIHLTLESGADVLLHDNHTWSCNSAAAREQLADIEITLEDGQEVFLGRDGTWTFIASDAAPDDGGFEMIYESGMARAPKALDAINAATKRALDGLTRRLKPSFDADVDVKDIRTCIGDIEKQVHHSEKKINGMYEVRIKITLDKTAIAAVKQCVALSERLKEHSADE